MFAPKQSDAGIYLHIPFCLKKCGYCSFVSYEKCIDLIDDYVKAIIKEIKNTKYANRKIETIFFGGGTPSLLKPKHIYSIMETLYDVFNISSNAEISMEANPGTVDRIKLKDYRECNINRISFGVQSLNDDDLKFLDRIHNRSEAIQAVNDANHAGFENINIDLIYGLPNRNSDVWAEVLKEALTLDITHLSMYALTLEEDTPLGKMVHMGKIDEPSDDVAADEYEVIDRLNNRFNQYEISNYALIGKECRHNLKYWKREDYFGFGVSAHSCVGRDRYSNTTDLKQYLDNLSSGKNPETYRESLNDDEILGETIMLALRTVYGVSYNDIKAVFNVEFKNKYRDEIIDLLSNELIEETVDGIKLSKRGRLLGNQVFMRFIN